MLTTKISIVVESTLRLELVHTLIQINSAFWGEFQSILFFGTVFLLRENL